MADAMEMLPAQFDTGKLCGANTRRGYNQATASGRPFYCFDPRPNEVYIEDIAAQLSRICRFGGAIRDGIEIYTVAQHCCLVSDHCTPDLQLEGLLHDAHEAYVGDKLKPIKMLLPEWKFIEGRVEEAVRIRFLLPRTMTPAVKEQDYRAVLTERRDIMDANTSVDWGSDLSGAWPEHITPWSISESRRQFLQRFNRLMQNRGHEVWA